MNKRYTASIAAGLLAVPLLALGANALLSPEEEDNYYEDTTTTAVVQTIAPVTTESRATYLEDVIRACGVEADYLLKLETGDFISPEQKAALDALREVCDQEGLPLAGPAAGDPIVETNTVFRDIPVVTPAQVSPTTTIASQESATPSVDNTTTTTVPGFEDEFEDDDEYEEYEDDDEYEHEEDDDDEEEHEYEGSQVASMQATALAAYQSAADAINANWTDDAEELFREGEEKYNKGEWKDAVEKFTKARNEANGGS